MNSQPLRYACSVMKFFMKSMAAGLSLELYVSLLIFLTAVYFIY